MALTDARGYLWDFQGDGSVLDGSTDAFDGGLKLSVSDGVTTTPFPYIATPTFEDANREVVCASASPILGVSVIRKAYVPDTGLGFARFTEFVTNNTAAAVTRTITISSGLGSDLATVVRGTSSGDLTVSVADNWVITDDGATDSVGDPAVLHYFASNQGMLRPTAVTRAGDVLTYSFSLTLNPGETKSIMHFSAQSQVLSDLTSLVAQLDSQAAAIYAAMTPAELAAVQNFSSTYYSAVSVTALPSNYSDLELTGTANINGTGNLSNNTINGNNGSNVLSGLDGNDILIGKAGNDTLNGGIGNDTLNGGVGNDALDGGAGVDAASYAGAASGVTVTLLNPGVQQNTVGAGLDTLSNIENLTGSGFNDTLTGNAGNNALDGGAGNDRLSGGLGNDVLNGGAGADTAVYNEFTANLTVDLNKTIAQNTGAGGTDTLIDIENVLGSVSGINRLTGNDANNTLTGGSNNDVLVGGLGSDVLTGGAGDDVIYGESLAVPGNLIRLDQGSFNASATALTFDNTGATNPSYTATVSGIGSVTVTTGGWFQGQAGGALGGNPSVITLTDATPTPASVLTLDAAAANVFVATDASTPTSPILSGTPQFNGPIAVRFSTPVAGVGLSGGYFNAINGTSIEAFDVNGNSLGLVTNTQTGIEFFGLAMSNGERKIAGISFYITGNEPAGFGIDNLTFGAATVINELLDTNDKLYGGTGNDSLYGGAGDDLLDGGSGNDVIRGDDGIDTALYASATAGVTVTLNSNNVQQNTMGAGLDTLVNIENLTGSQYNDTLTGNASANVLNGGLGNDVLNGGAGVDTASYEGVASGVTVTLLNPGVQQNTVGAGLDTLSNIENLAGSSFSDALLGNAGANVLDGGAGNDILNGGAGDDALNGGAGVDTASYLGAVSGVTVTLQHSGVQQNTVGAGLDTLSGIENLTGSSFDDTLIGNASANILDGGSAGDDTMNGGAGDDTYVVSGVGGSVLIEDSVGIDTLDASAASAGVTIDLTPGGSSNIDGRIVTLAAGGSVSIPLDVLFLQDLSSSFNDDIATVRTLVPQVVNALSAFQSDVRFGLSSFIDKPTGGFGVSTDYVYRTDLAMTNDSASLLATLNALTVGNGSDVPEAQIEALMQAAIRQGEVGFRGDSFRAAVVMTDANFHVAGDFAGAPANNGDAVLNGTPAGSGEDYPTIELLRAKLLAAGVVPVFAVTATNETYYNGLVANLGFGTVVTLASDSSNLVSVLTTGLTQITEARIENATGSAFNDTLIGNNLVNQLAGGAGNDTYYVQNSGDRVVELAGAGTGVDLVNSSVSYTLSANVEHLTLTGAANINATGNELNNILVGNAADNLITGGAGNDRLLGGRGNDTYQVASNGDRVIEYSGNGVDTVMSSISYTLGANLENLTLTGATAIDGVGNELGNTLVGNSAANILNGRAGADTLTGGLGADIFLINSLTGIDTITDFVAVDDTIRLENAVFTSLTAVGTLAAGNLRAGAGFTTAADTNDYLIYNSTTGALYYDADGSGAGAAVQFATLGATTHPALTAADMVVI